MSESRAQAVAAAIFSDFIVCRKMRQTPERMSILRTAIDMPSHFSPAELIRKLNSSGSAFSVTTVYSTLSILVDAGILRRVLFDSRVPLYERSLRVCGNCRTRKHHHHLVCTSCGRIAETHKPDVSPEILQSMLGKNSIGFTPGEISLTVYGLCRRCRRKASAASGHGLQMLDNN